MHKQNDVQTPWMRLGWPQPQALPYVNEISEESQGHVVMWGTSRVQRELDCMWAPKLQGCLFHRTAYTCTKCQKCTNCVLAEMSGCSVASLKIGNFFWFLWGILKTYCFRDCQSAAALCDRVVNGQEHTLLTFQLVYPWAWRCSNE